MKQLETMGAIVVEALVVALWSQSRHFGVNLDLYSARCDSNNVPTY